MASNAGTYPVLPLGTPVPASAHYIETTTPGLPVKADATIDQGVMVAYDPANSQAEVADPAMAATAIVIGVNLDAKVDNTDGAKGAKTVMPHKGTFRIANDGNLTAAHLFQKVRVIDDHTVGVPTGTSADRIAGVLVGLDGSGHVWVAIGDAFSQRAPMAVTLTSSNGTAAAAADLAALKTETEKIGDDVRAIHDALVAVHLIAPAP